MTTYVANARMYSVNPAVAGAWKSMFGWLSEQSGVQLDVIDHAFPAPLSELWSRADIACVFMCGFPFLHAAQEKSCLMPSNAIAGSSVIGAPGEQLGIYIIGGAMSNKLRWWA